MACALLMVGSLPVAPGGILELRTGELFATKGAEYLTILAYLAVLALFWRLLHGGVAGGARRMALGVERALPEWFGLDEGLHYHQGHGWARPESGGTVRVGIDDFAQRLLGPADALELPPVGARLSQGTCGWQLRFGKTRIPMLAPVSGEVLEVNAGVVRDPALPCREPYGAGWLLRVRSPRVKADMKGLLSGRLARAWADESVGTLRRRIEESRGTAVEAAVLQDGGLPVTGIARRLSPEGWEEIAREYLLAE